MFNVYMSLKDDDSLYRISVDGSDLTGGITSFIQTIAFRAKTELANLYPLVNLSDINVVRIENA